MSESQVNVVIAITLVVAAGAMLTLAYCAFQALKTLRRMERRTDEFIDHWTPVAADTERFLRTFSAQAGELVTRLNDLTARLQKQSVQVESAIANLTSVAERNADSLNSGLRHLVGHISTMAAVFEHGIRGPIRQLRAIRSGVSAAVRSLSSGPRPVTPDRISVDEEMFL